MEMDISRIEKAYREMPDEEFFALKREELREEVQGIYDREVQRRSESAVEPSGNEDTESVPTESNGEPKRKKSTWVKSLSTILILFVIWSLVKYSARSEKENEKARQAEIAQQMAKAGAYMQVQEINDKLMRIHSQHERLDKLLQIIGKKVNGETLGTAEKWALTRDPLFKDAVLTKDQLKVLADEYQSLINGYEGIRQEAESMGHVDMPDDFNDNVNAAKHNLGLIEEARSSPY